ncbi:MAG: hypothetical protein QNJ68_03535 [Microcoleaceae cyanobacterium MO_207.B10]|nr:hypothetical protein [Microcoleaceae cyanobacterium MO_207.B10]
MGKTATAAGGSLTIKPYFDSMVGRFIAKNNLTGSSDTCIITGYQPNLQDLKQGGTFTLGGF